MNAIQEKYYSAGQDEWMGQNNMGEGSKVGLFRQPEMNENGD